MKTMNKIAVCFSGQIRTGLYAAPNIKRFIGNLWSNCDFFIHTWNNESFKNYGRDTLNGQSLIPRKDRYLNSTEINNFINLYKPKNFKIEDFDEFKNKNENTVKNIVWYTNECSLMLCKEYELENNFKYDMIVKTRPDIIFGSKRRLVDEINLFIKNPNMLYSDVISIDRLDDVFWIMSSDTAEKFKGIFNHVNDATDSRQVVLEWLNYKQISKISTARTSHQYAVFRLESLGRNPLTEFKEIFRDDRLLYSVGWSEDDMRKRFKSEDEHGINYD